MEPDAAQREALARNAGARRYVWNWALGRKRDYYRKNRIGLRTSILKAELPILKRNPETAWLADADSQSLQEALRDLDRAFKSFFEGRSRFPRFKSRKWDEARFRISQRVAIADGVVSIPKIGSVRIRQSQPVDGETKSATFKQDAAGHWHVTLVTEFTMPDTALPAADPDNVIGIDLGLRDFAVLSDGGRIPGPRFFRKNERKLRRAQRVFSRRKKGSARRLRANRAVSLVHRKTAHQRKDFLHKLTSRLVVKYDGICIEDLSVKGLVRTKLAKSTTDASFGEFRRQLEYKTVWKRRYLAVVDRWYPSSKTCRACGAVNDALTLADRTWTCVCGVCHDRDLNAALNVRSEGLKILTAGHAERITARGPDVRLPQVEAVGVEA
jgi:putative transposase